MLSRFKQLRARFGPYLRGWRGSVTGAAILAASVFITNFIVLVVGLARESVITRGDCNRAATIYTSWHIVINFLSTLLLGASNYCIQVLCAPTREDIDKAHAGASWLSIGVVSLRNVRAPRRLALVALIALSSVPLHFFYNSVFLHELAAYEYLVVGAYSDLTNSTAYRIDTPPPNWLPAYYPYSMDHVLSEFNKDESSYLSLLPGNLTNRHAIEKVQQAVWDKTAHYQDWRSCISLFENGLTFNYSGVVLISGASHDSSSVVPMADIATVSKEQVADQASWMCDTSGNYSASPDRESLARTCSGPLLRQASAWSVPAPIDGAQTTMMLPIDYCLVVEEEQRCTVAFSPQLMLIVLLCNAIKLACFVATPFAMKGSPLVTLGDAIASFLERPSDFKDDQIWLNSEKPLRATTINIALNRLYRKAVKPRHRANVLSAFRWLATVLSCIILLVIGTCLLLVHRSAGTWEWNFFHSSQTNNIINSVDTNLTGMSLVANMPQFLVSCAYLLYNNAFTSMQLAVEYGRFTREAKPLRVTEPRGLQRSTYWLQLPYRYSLLLMLAMFILHWLISQSLYMVDIAPEQSFGRGGVTEKIIALGWNPAAVLLSLLVGMALTAFLILNSFRTLPTGMRIIPNNSMALAAACHRSPVEGPEMSRLPLKYGTLPHVVVNGRTFEGFTARTGDIARLSIDIPNQTRRWYAMRWGQARKQGQREEEEHELFILRGMPSVAVWQRKSTASSSDKLLKMPDPRRTGERLLRLPYMLWSPKTLSSVSSVRFGSSSAFHSSTGYHPVDDTAEVSRNDNRKATTMHGASDSLSEMGLTEASSLEWETVSSRSSTPELRLLGRHRNLSGPVWRESKNRSSLRWI